MFEVYEVNTGETVHAYTDERMAWSAAYTLNDAHAEAMGLNYTVRRV
jgi:hypothetical protein